MSACIPRPHPERSEDSAEGPYAQRSESGVVTTGVRLSGAGFAGDSMAECDAQEAAAGRQQARNDGGGTGGGERSPSTRSIEGDRTQAVT